MNGFKLSFVFFAAVVVCAKAASLGDALVTVYADPAVLLETDADLRGKRDADFEPLERTKHQHHHHHHHHHGGEYESGHHEVYSKPSTCYKCGGGGGGPSAVFASSSAGAINGNSGHGGYGGHGNGGNNAVSQSAAYNFGPFSAAFSASQSNGGFGGFF